MSAGRSDDLLLPRSSSAEVSEDSLFPRSSTAEVSEDSLRPRRSTAERAESILLALSTASRRRARVFMVRHALHIRFVSFSVDVLFPSAARSGGLKRDGGQSPSAVAFRATLLGNSTRPGERGAPRTRSCDSRCPLDAQMTSCCLAVAPLRAQTPPCRHAGAPLRAWRIPCVRAVGAKDGGRLLPRLSRPPSFCRLPFIRNRYRGFNR